MYGAFLRFMLFKFQFVCQRTYILVRENFGQIFNRLKDFPIFKYVTINKNQNQPWKTSLKNLYSLINAIQY